MRIQKNKNKKHSISNSSGGQVMMIVVLILSGIIIGATAISGALTARQTRQTVDAGSSSKTIFASDAGLEWRLYKFIQDDYLCVDCPNGNVCDQKPQFEKDKEIETTLSTTCVKKGEDVTYNYFTISSTAKVRDSSYTYKEDLRIIK